MGERHLFYDELGQPIEFIIIAKFSVDDMDYAALLPAEDIESMTYILRVEIDSNGDEILVGIDDDDELQDAIDVFEELQRENLQ